MHLVVVTPLGSKVDTEISEVSAPGTVGSLGILPGHLPLLTSLREGQLTFTGEGKRQHLAVNGGFLEVSDDKIIIVTETAETPDEIDVERAKKSLADAERKIAELKGGDKAETLSQAIAQQRRAETRLAVAKFATPAALKKN